VGPIGLIADLVEVAAVVILSVRLLDRQPGRWRTIWKAFRR
jgi:hypothetical protein